jgi:hypothetical protein
MGKSSNFSGTNLAIAVGIEGMVHLNTEALNNTIKEAIKRERSCVLEYERQN